MPTRRSTRMVLAQLLVVGCVAVSGARVLIEHARAQQQFVPPPPPPAPPPPAPVFNPPSPNRTVPQPAYTPVSPATPSAAPGTSVTPPVNESPPRSAARSQERSSAARSHERTSAAKKRSVHHRRRSRIVGPAPESYSYDYPPFGYDYGCAWRRAWDGYWFRTSPCS
jgi:type IV secretory pathway VirB10-like protein